MLFFLHAKMKKNTFSDQSSIYLTGDIAQNATTDSVLFSFRLFSEDLTNYDLNLLVNIAGEAMSTDRTFELEVVPEKTNVTEADYTIGTLKIPANAYEAVIPINVNRNITALDLSSVNARLTLRVKENDNFKVGSEEYSEYTLAWCDYLIEPITWSIISYYIGPFSQARFKFIIDYTGITDFSDFAPNGSTDYDKVLNLQANLMRLLTEYNEAHPGAPYLNDNGEPLEFGSGLPY